MIEGAKPVALSQSRLNPQKGTLVQKEITHMLRLGIIEPSESPWASPLVLVPKSDESIRLCTDYRKVNALTVADIFPLPRVEDFIDRA